MVFADLVARGLAGVRLVTSDAPSVHAQFDKLLDLVADKLPAAHEHVDAARADRLDRDAVTRLVGARPGRQHDEWVEGRR